MCSFMLSVSVLLIVRQGLALRIQSLDVPPTVNRGVDLTLACQYDLEGEQLYTSRWYCNEREVFRYRPRDTPAKRSFDIPGITLDLGISNSTHLKLVGVTFASSGTWRCEVAGEAPGFNSDTKSAPMRVVVLPQQDPTIKGDQKLYPERPLTLNCTSRKSHPPVNLTWLIDGVEAPEEHLRSYSALQHPDDTYTTTLGLQISLSDYNYPSGKLKVKCIARISDIYWKVNELTLQSPSLLAQAQHKGKASCLSSGVFHLPLVTVLVLLSLDYVTVR